MHKKDLEGLAWNSLARMRPAENERVFLRRTRVARILQLDEGCSQWLVKVADRLHHLHVFDSLSLSAASDSSELRADLEAQSWMRP